MVRVDAQRRGGDACAGPASRGRRAGALGGRGRQPSASAPARLGGDDGRSDPGAVRSAGVAAAVFRFPAHADAAGAAVGRAQRRNPAPPSGLLRRTDRPPEGRPYPAFRGALTMKFLLFMLPVVPATREERRRLRPIAANTERFQMMIDQVVETARVADDLGFDMLSFPEHFLQTEGLEMGATPSLYAHVAAHTRNIKLGPMGFVLPGWNPLRLACEVGWLDQITRGRVFVGLARGYQTRWLNPMAQRLQISATLSDQSEIDKANREAFDEVLRILKLAWGDEPFSFKGKYY